MDSNCALSDIRPFDSSFLESLDTDMCSTTHASDCDELTTKYTELAFDLLRKKVFSRYGELTDELAKSTRTAFRQRNIRAGLWNLRSVHKHLLNKGYSGPQVLEMLSTIRFHLEKWCRTVCALPVSFDFEPTGPGATNSLSDCTDHTRKLYWGDQSVGSKACYARYVSLLRLCNGSLSRLAPLERYRLRHCRTTIRAQKLIVIAKNSSSGRLIMPQNGIDLFCQKELGTRMVKALDLCFGINLSTAPAIHNRLAREGSMDNSISTIDSTAASDSIVMKMCSNLLTKQLFAEISACRNPYFLHNGKPTPMHIVAGMGNDFCFPLQTAIFTVIAKVACMYTHVRVDLGRSFGDDIIVPTAAAPLCLDLLEALGFVPNREKSFIHQDYTRESCGGYYYKGLDFRAFRISSSSEADLTRGLNELRAWTAGTGIVLKRCYDTLVKYGARLNPVPYTSEAAQGVRILKRDIDPELVRRMSDGSWTYHAFLPKETWSPLYKLGPTQHIRRANGAMRMLRGLDMDEVTSVIMPYIENPAGHYSPISYTLGYRSAPSVSWVYYECNVPIWDDVPVAPPIEVTYGVLGSGCARTRKYTIKVGLTDRFSTSRSLSAEEISFSHNCYA